MDYIKNRPEDFMIRVRPFLDKKERWTGEIDVVPIMDKDTAVREMMNDYVINSLDTSSKDDINDRGTVEDIKDNVITINFKPSTKH